MLEMTKLSFWEEDWALGRNLDMPFYWNILNFGVANLQQPVFVTFVDDHLMLLEKSVSLLQGC